MSNNCNTIASVLLRGGTDQLHRTSDKLAPESIQIHGFGISEWMEFAFNFASNHVKYFNTSNGIEDGFWSEFFKDEAATKELLDDLENSDELTPHLTLFICFLRLLEYSSKRLNNITKRHLDFYYQEVLQIEKLPPTYDRVNILFELSKHIIQEKLEAGTLLNAGKDANGAQMYYELSEETSLNACSISQLSNFYFDPDYLNPSTNAITPQYYMKAGEVANSINGTDKALPEEQTSWYGFGYNHNRVASPFEEIPDAKIGFAISSHVLSLSEGTRHIQFDIKCTENLDVISFMQLRDVLDVYYTAEKGWSEKLSLESSFVSPPLTFSTSINTATKTIRLYLKLDPKAEASFPYNVKTHGGSFNTTNPVFRFVLKTNSPEGLLVYKNFVKKIATIDVNVKVIGMRKLILDNDNGTLNPKKPIYPFTNTPVKGSSFTVYHEEIFSKQWDSVKVHIAWKNTPSDLVYWYDAYKQPFVSNFLPVSYINGYDLPNGKFSAGLPTIVGSNSYFKATRSIRFNGEWNKLAYPVVTLFTGSGAFETEFSFDGTGYSAVSTEGIRISLNQSFLHEMYPKLYATSLINAAKNAALPNEPYTPLTEDVSVTYTAHDTILLNSDSVDTFEKRTNNFYHEHPFGISLQHPYLKSQLSFVSSSNCTLVPKHCRGGELYIGLENAQNLQNVSLLIQILEGTENKQTATFLGNQKIVWEILCSEHWKELDSTLLLKNETDNFLQTGIVSFKIPKEATNDNTSLSGSNFWVRAKMMKSFDAVCQVINIHAQVGQAIFKDNENELSHLETGLPAGTIKKLIQRSSKIKSVKQPYNSFGGSPEESDAQYYRRVSERLRHKNRAITLWDYEHIVLQEFPELFRVKCLNHTSPSSYTAAGHVSLVVIPDTVNKNVFDRFQPRVSTAFLNRIYDHVSKLNSLHVKLHVANPDYEEVKVSLKIQFRKGLDETLYKIQLNDDIIRFLSPWAYDESKQVDFGRSLHISILINYIEKLNYVDYLQDVTMSVNGGVPVMEYTPSTPKSVMVSSASHSISTEIITCDTATQNITEECQQ